MSYEETRETMYLTSLTNRLTINIFDFNMYRLLGWIWRIFEFCIGFDAYVVVNILTAPKSIADGWKYAVEVEAIKIQLFWTTVLTLSPKWASQLLSLRGKMFPIKAVYK